MGQASLRAPSPKVPELGAGMGILVGGDGVGRSIHLGAAIVGIDRTITGEVGLGGGIGIWAMGTTGRKNMIRS
ncbi:hypothetical protein ACN4EG_07085 [Alkalinema pantanalense CENA528]|uniref:hypothetical protein n=1 Tax=Alkalinema pantanalense TaxID=1620705 RepID=UPI003D6FA50C